MSDKPNFAFTKRNYQIMIAGLIILIIGFFVMTLDNETYGFGFLGLTLGPLIVMVGFLTQFAAILYKPKSNKNEE